jgi:hypothetical protein
MEHQSGLEKMNISHALKIKPISSLDGILKNLDPVDLFLTAIQFRISSGFIVQKEKLIKEILDHSLERGRIESALIATRPREYDLFLSLLNQEYIQDNELPFGDYGHLLNNGIIFSFYNKGKIFFNVPDEIKEVFASRDKEVFDMMFEENQLIYKYIMAFVNLYGVFSKDMLIEVFNSQNDEVLTLDDFEAVLEMCLLRQQPFYEDDDFIVNHYFDEENLYEMDLILENADDMTHYIPDREDILKYSDDTYIEMTPQLEKLKAFIINNMSASEELAADVVYDIETACSMECSLQDIVYELERRKIFFKSTEQFDLIAPLIEDVCNNVRIWINLGHTNAEMFEIKGRTSLEITDEPVELVIDDEPLIYEAGGNELCTCGSGKKYKDCCGEIEEYF